MTPLTNTLHDLIGVATNQLPNSLKGVKSNQKPAYKKRRRTKKKVA
jgi:hypothetical protein